MREYGLSIWIVWHAAAVRKDDWTTDKRADDGVKVLLVISESWGNGGLSCSYYQSKGSGLSDWFISINAYMIEKKNEKALMCAQTVLPLHRQKTN